MEFGFCLHPQRGIAAPLIDMFKAVFLIFLCLLSLSAVAYRSVHDTALDSAMCRQLAADIEAFLNKQQIPITGNRQIEMVLSFDTLQRFVPILPDYAGEVERAIGNALSDFDGETGELSRNTVLTDTRYVYSLTSFMDKELKRFWFTKIEKVRKGEKPDAVFVTYEIMPEARGGMGLFLDSISNQLKAYRGAPSLFKRDTLIISFIVDTADVNVPKKVRVDGIENRDIEQIVAGSGVWVRGIYYGLAVPAYVEVEFYKALLTAGRREPLHADGRHIHFIMFPRLADAEYMQVFPYHSSGLMEPGAVVVSFILNDHQPVMHGELILQGSRENGMQLLDRIKQQLGNSPLIKSFQPSRFYVSFPAHRL